MSKQALSLAKVAAETGLGSAPAALRSHELPMHAKARPIPRISIQAFCENPAIAEVLQAASTDRRLAKSHVSVHMGGVAAAVAHYHENPTPNLIVLETSLSRSEMLAE